MKILDAAIDRRVIKGSAFPPIESSRSRQQKRLVGKLHSLPYKVNGQWRCRVIWDGSTKVVEESICNLQVN